MTATNHVLAGTIIAITVSNPFAAILLALLSHLALDVMPHFGGSKFYTNHAGVTFRLWLAGDALCALAVMAAAILLMPQHWLLIGVCGSLAAAPDLLWLPDFITALKSKPARARRGVRKLLSIIQWGERPWGIAVEALWFAGGLWILAHTALSII